MARKARRVFTEEQKQAIVAELATAKSKTKLLKKHGLWQSVFDKWVKTYGDPRKQAPKASPKAAEMPDEPKTKLQIIGLTPMIRELVEAALPAAVEAALPAAVEAALTRRFAKGG